MTIKRLTAAQILFAVLLLALGLRLFHVTYPYLDHHTWRQTDTAAIARNFLRDGFNPLRPKLDMYGPDHRVVELELQITPLLTAGLYEVFSIQDWVGRVVPILFSLLAIVYFYRLVSLHFGERRGLFAAFVFAILPLNVYFTRVLMPEAAGVFLAIAAVYYFSVYLQRETNSQYALAIGFTALAVLAKLTNLYILVPLAALAVMRYGRHGWSNVRLWLFVPLTLAIPVVYYSYMHATADIHLIPYQVGTDKWAHVVVLTSPLFYLTLGDRLRTIIFTDLGLILLIVGVVQPTANRLFHFWLAAALVYVFAVATGNYVHTYYQLPLIPAGAFFIGSALDRLAASKRWRPLAGVLSVSLLALAIMNLLPLYELKAVRDFQAARAFRQVDASTSPVLAVPALQGTMPVILYYADRKGWALYPEQLTVQAVDFFRAQGARFVVIADYHQVPDATRQYLSGYTRWQGEYALVVRLAP